MASLEKPITESFEVVYPKAKDGPAGEFLADETRSEHNLDRAIAMTEYVMLNRRGLNPYREDMADKMQAKEYFPDVSDNELDATRHMLGTLKAMRNAVKVVQMKAISAGVKVEAIANKVNEPSVVDKEELDAGKEVEEKPEKAEAVRKAKKEGV